MTDISSKRSPLRLPAALCLILLPLAACSSASGEGDDHPPRDRKVIVVPRGTDVVCPDGSHPPCP
ncbi:hypothetical protein ACLRDC_00380 [Gluconacetobacter sacchari]|uniref:Lipoprotein n=2 Tax=Gluconacetobacter sacchari TaxID=92759 RepID=A0A7W4IEK6_9PROT|nr:hypothetical protein [Gluconacetobacter sacchari]MBB2161317.1 hypothetical protein [Gluconacetobacter sacchari]GBQ30608.1 hypothetical protein AA12717_3536 [Gluconacetobacter sacchari DSM 12717]